VLMPAPGWTADMRCFCCCCCALPLCCHSAAGCMCALRTDPSADVPAHRAQGVSGAAPGRLR
jgi:hypothetical protein